MAIDEPIEILDESFGSGPRPARRARALLAVLALLGLLVTGLMIRSAEPDVEVADGDEEPEEPTTERDPGPNRIALGAPDDGKGSVGLPVTAEPSTGLRDGQAVTVTGSGFPPNESVGVVMCTREAGREHGGRGAEACDIGRYASATSGADGVVVATFHVQRILLLDGQEVDCASEPGRCIIGVGLISDYDRSGGFAVDFDPSAPLAPAPTVGLARTGGIVDGETVAANVTGLHPGSTLIVQQCETATQRCAPVGEHHVDGDGVFDGSVHLWRWFGAWTEPGQSPNVDCAAVPCHVMFDAPTSGPGPLPTVDVTFDGTRGARTPPVVRLARPGPFAPGDWVELEVEGASPGAHADAAVCAADGSWCSGSGTTQVGPDGGARFTLWIETGSGSRRCGGTCILTVQLFPDLPPGAGPPPLFPPRIPVEVRG
jgi:hypothetical protein